MNREPSPPSFEAIVRTMQIIVAALSLGVLFYGGFVAASAGVPNGDFAVRSTFAWLSLGAGLVGMFLSWVVPRLMPIASSDSEVHDEIVRRRLGVIQIRLIVGLALCEGVAFLNLFAASQDGSTPNFLMAVVLLGAMIIRFPTSGSIAAKLDDLERDDREKRQWK